MYPRMQLVTFHSVKVDNQTPTVQADDESALVSPNGIAISPGPFQNDAFAEHFVTGAGRQYLRDVLPLDVAINRFNSSLPGSASVLRSASQAFAKDLQGQRWPPSVEPGVRRLIGHEHRIVEELGHTGDPTDPLSPVQSSLRADLTFAGAVRAALGLPPTDPK